MLSTAFLMHPEVYNQVDRQECVRVDLGTGVTQKLSTDFIRVVPQTSRNHVSTLEVQTAEKPVTMRVCGQVQIVNWGLFYPVVLPNFHGLNFAGKWL